jgi:hypothetical protein
LSHINILSNEEENNRRETSRSGIVERVALKLLREQRKRKAAKTEEESE